MSARRFSIPSCFHYTRLDRESVEVVLASEYDALTAQFAEVTQELTQERDDYKERAKWKHVHDDSLELELQKQLTEAKAELAELKEIRDVQQSIIQAFNKENPL
jgi:maltodextrin utilization protein YvdJ